MVLLLYLKRNSQIISKAFAITSFSRSYDNAFLYFSLPPDSVIILSESSPEMIVLL